MNLSTIISVLLSFLFGVPSTPAPTSTPSPMVEERVLGESDSPIIFTVNVPAVFNSDITAPNVVYSLTAGEGVGVTSSQTPTITNTGVLSLQGSTGALTLTAGTGISLSGLTITNTGITSLTAGSGISISGSTITNTSTPDYTLSGWTDNGTGITLTTTTDTVTVGTLTAGAVSVDSLTTDGLSLTSDLTVASGHSLLPAVDLGSDLGSASKRFNNVYAANLTIESGISSSGQAIVTYNPANTTFAESSLRINVTAPSANEQMLGIGVAGYQRALIDEDGDIILGYSDATSAPATDYPLDIYGHSGTRVSFTDTSGNGYFAGNVGIGTTSPEYSLEIASSSTPALFSSTNNSVGAQLILKRVGSTTPYGRVDFHGTSGSSNTIGAAIVSWGGALNFYTDPTPDNTSDNLTSRLNINSSGNANFNSGQLYVQQSNGNIGIGTTSPNDKLEVISTDDAQLRLAYDTSNYHALQVANDGGLAWSALGTDADLNLDFSGATDGDFSVNTDDLFVDTSTGYMGIGTAAPTANLDIAAITGSDALRITNSGTKVLGLGYGTNYTSFDAPSTDPTNKLLNPTFDSDLTSWSEVPSYTLNDEFTTDLAAGSVNGTSAEPTGGTRTVVDTNNKLSITGSQLSFATGGVGNGNPGLWYPSITRSAGTVLTNKATFNGVSGSGNSSHYLLALDSDQSSYPGAEGFLISGGSGAGIIIAVINGVSRNLGTASPGTEYKLAYVLKSTGTYYFIKGGTYTNWTLLYISPTGSGATLYPAVMSGTGTDAPLTADNIRIPTATWLPTPLAYDTFTRDDGAIGDSETTGPDSQTTPALTWTGGAISSNKNVITPSLGSDMFDAGAGVFTSGTYAWTAGGTNTIENDTNSLKISYVDDSEGATELLRDSSDLTSDLSTGGWYLAQFDAKVNTGSVNVRFYNALGSSDGAITNTDFETKYRTIRAISDTGNFIRTTAMTTGEIIWFDNLSLKPLTLSSLFSTVSTSDADVIADANVTLTAGTQAGLVLNLDDTTTPANFIIVYHDGTNVKVDEAVAGVYTNKQTTTVTYSAGATLRAIREGTKLRVYYNNALVGSELTMTANTNTIHGLFSTYSGNSFDNFTLWPRGSGTTKFTDAPFEELTATHETTTTYNGSAGSVQLVAGGTDANYLQSVNVGDTSTYTLIAYAYTDGSAVTSSDLELYYDTAVLATTYTAMGGTGWYKLTGSFTGVASAKDYGVRVKAGKTVYVDEPKVQEGVGTTQTMYVLNSGTGVTGLNVQGLINGSLNGIATLTKAGTISDSDFTDTPINGLFGFDTTNHRLYFRENGAWSYIARNEGFQIPNYESEGLSQGDYLISYVDGFMSDGAAHGLYVKWSEVKNVLLSDVTIRLETLENIFEEFTTKKSHQEEFCVGTTENETCLTKDKLDEVLRLLPTPLPVESPQPSPIVEDL